MFSLVLAYVFQERFSGALARRTRYERACCAGLRRGVRLLHIRHLCAQCVPGRNIACYFESAAVIVTLILLGRGLEARAKGRTGAAIERLIGLKAKSARVLREGAEVEIPLDEVLVGDIVLVKPGDKVPVDGQVIEGSSFVDKSMLTGEPTPVTKGIRANVVGGTINTTGSFSFRVAKTGADTALAQIIRMVKKRRARNCLSRR